MEKYIVYAGAVLALTAMSGCIVAIGNDSRDEGRQVRLTETQRGSLPVVKSYSDLPTIETVYASQLRELGPATTVEEFRTKFPDAKFVERRELGSPVDAYSVRIDQVYRREGKSYGYLARDEAWFFFREGRFIKRGAAGQWP